MYAMMLGYSSILLIKEGMQIMGQWDKHGDCRFYYTSISNWVDLLCIACVFGLGIGLVMKSDTVPHDPWLKNFVYIVVLIAWFQFWKDIMECIPLQSFPKAVFRDLDYG